MGRSGWVVALGLLACGGSASSRERAPGSGASGDSSPSAAQWGGARDRGEDGVDLGRPNQLGGDSPCPPAPLSLSDTLAAALQDVRSRPASDRPFLRYVSTAQFRSGPCSANQDGSPSEDPGEDVQVVERARSAVSKLANSLSREPSVVMPQQVGPEGLLLRLDLRDYGWQRSVTVQGQQQDDAWEAIVAHAAIALGLQGGAASELSRELDTSVPILLSSSFVATGLQAEVYSGILQLPATLAELQRQLGIDGEQGLEQGPWARAGLSNSGVSKEPRGVARYRGAVLGDGYYWQTFEHAPSARASSQYLAPLATEADGHMVLFSLANGLPAYFVSDGSGQRQAEARYLVDPAQNNGRMRLASSCVSCHNGGIIPFADAVRPFVEENTDLFSAVDLARVRDTFLPAAQMQALADADSGSIGAALERAGQPSWAPDPLSRVALDYELGLDFDQLAAELFLDRAALIAQLPSLPEPIAAAATSGKLERAAFEALYLQAACAVYSGADSSPVGCP